MGTNDRSIVYLGTILNYVFICNSQVNIFYIKKYSITNYEAKTDTKYFIPTWSRKVLCYSRDMN